MFKLNIPTEPTWIELPHGVRVKVKPLTTVLLYSTQALTRKALEKHGDLPEEAMDGVRLAEFITALARLSIVEWEGVWQADGVQTAPVNDTTVADLMKFYDMAESFNAQYFSSREAVETEKKPFSEPSDGTETVEPITAETALIPA